MENVKEVAEDKNGAMKITPKDTNAPASTEESKSDTKCVSEVNAAGPSSLVEVHAANSKSSATAMTAKTTASTVAGKMELNQAVSPLIITETISISDDEDSSPTHTAPSEVLTEATAKKRKKGSSLDARPSEEHFKLKRRKIKVAGAPKMPLTGYVRYMNERRELLKKEQPSKTAIEHTKLIGEEWSQLSEERKTPYMKAAEEDKQRYLSELHAFLKARPDVLACELAKNKPRKSAGSSSMTDDGASMGRGGVKDKLSNSNAGGFKDTVKELTKEVVKELTKDDLAITTSASRPRPSIHTRRLSVNYALPSYTIRESSPPVAPVVAAVLPPLIARKRTPTPPSNNNYTSSFNTPVPGEIPIFTNEFLEHNKAFDMELRMLRKSKADLEQQNAVLEKHVENMKFGVEKMISENDELQEKNRLLELYLEKLKRKLANALSGLAIPSEPQGATMENIDKYMNDLYKMATSNTHGPASLNKARDIIRKLDLQIQL